jgi:riboflavin synthase
MFTGLVQAVGTVASLEGGRLVLSAPNAWDDPLEIGESIAVNGCCLTLVAAGPDLEFDLSEETLRRTAFGTLHAGARVNLERALRAGDRMGGHFVQGHVDGVGRLVSRMAHEGSETFRFAMPAQGSRYLIDKGSVAVDGVSLTVIEPGEATFDVSLIPHTLGSTNLGDRQPGDPVNLEYDVLAKYVERMLGR